VGWGRVGVGASRVDAKPLPAFLTSEAPSRGGLATPKAPASR